MPTKSRGRKSEGGGQTGKAGRSPTADVRPPDSAGKLGISLEYFTEYQRAWIRDESPMKLAEKSRRIGWTYATTFRRVRRALKVPGLPCWISTRDLTTAKEFVRDCGRWCRLANVVAKGLDGENVEVVGPGDITAQVIEFPNGSRIHILTSNPDALAGKGGDVVLDEFALHKDQTLLWQVALPTASVWGFQVEVISTHRGKNTLFNKFCEDAKSRNKMGWSFYSVNIVQACEQGLIARINAETAKRGRAPTTAEEFIATQRARCATEQQWMQEFMCVPQDDMGSLLTYEMLTACEMPWEDIRKRAARPAVGPVYLGMDIGRKHDLSVIWMVEQLGPMAMTRAIHVMEKAPFHVQLDAVNRAIEEHNVRRACIDANGIGAMIAEEAARKWGEWRVEQVQITAPVKEELAMGMLRAFQDKAFRIPDDYDVREDLHKVEKQVTAAGHVRYVAASDEDGHADRFFGAALALYARGKAEGPPRAMSVAAAGGDDRRGDWMRPDHTGDDAAGRRADPLAVLGDSRW